MTKGDSDTLGIDSTRRRAEVIPVVSNTGPLLVETSISPESSGESDTWSDTMQPRS